MSYHTHHLTPLARLALKVPGTWAWSAVLRLHLATKPCRCSGPRSKVGVYSPRTPTQEERDRVRAALRAELEGAGR